VNQKLESQTVSLSRRPDIRYSDSRMAYYVNSPIVQYNGPKWKQITLIVQIWLGAWYHEHTISGVLCVCVCYIKGLMYVQIDTVIYWKFAGMHAVNVLYVRFFNSVIT
jgi:hypothetical protein